LLSDEREGESSSTSAKGSAVLCADAAAQRLVRRTAQQRRFDRKVKLVDRIVRARAEIARVAGTNPAKVRIAIEM